MRSASPAPSRTLASRAAKAASRGGCSTRCAMAAVDPFVGRGKNIPKKSPAGVACWGPATVLCRPPLFGRYAPSSLWPAKHRKTSRLRIYRSGVALTELPGDAHQPYFCLFHHQKTAFTSFLPNMLQAFDICCFSMTKSVSIWLHFVKSSSSG